MNCAECRDQMLEAGLKELAGDGESAVAAHVRSCEACRFVAVSHLAATRELRTSYDAAVPATSPAGMRGRRVRRRAAFAVAMLAAAAMLAVSVVARREAPEDLHGGHWVTPYDPAAASISVEVPDGRNAIVFATKNPLVDVVWIY